MNNNEKPPKITLTEILKQRGIKEAKPDDPIYQTRFAILLRAPLRRPTQKQPKFSETGGLEGPSQQPLIDRNSKEPEDRKKWVQWLAFLTVAFRAPQAILLPRVREVLLSARKDGVNWQDLYKVASEAIPDWYPQPPDLDLVAPER